MSMENDNMLKIAAEMGDINLLYTIIQDDPYVLQNIDLIPFVETPLHIAASLGHLQFATEVMRLKPSFAWKLNRQGFSPIHLAIQNGQKSMMLRFVEVDNNLVRVKGREGLTPLHLASQTGQVDLLANFLYACPDSIEDVNVRSETALHIAVKNEQCEALQVLIGWLKRTRHKGAMELEKMILNWKDEAGNTILHISILANDSQTVKLLVKTKMDLKARNLENSTALDIAGSAEMKRILSNAGVKHGSSVTNPPTFAEKLRSRITIMDKILICILRIRKDISEEQRNAFLIIAALIATATYQSALSPPGGVFQANAGENNMNMNTTSSNSTAINSLGNKGKSVMSEGDFLVLSIFNTLTLLLSTIIIYILTPSGIVGSLLYTPMFWFAYCYIYAMKVISPTSATTTFNTITLHIINFLHSGMFWIFSLVYKFRIEAKNREIKTRNSAGRNKW